MVYSWYPRSYAKYNFRKGVFRSFLACKLPVGWGWGDRSTSKVLLCKYENLDLVPRTQIKEQGLASVLVFPALGRWRQMDPRGLLSSQPSLFGVLQTNETLYLQNQINVDGS